MVFLVFWVGCFCYLLPTLRQGGGHAERPQSHHHQHGRQGMGTAVLYNSVTLFTFFATLCFLFIVHFISGTSNVAFSNVCHPYIRSVSSIFRICIQSLMIRIRIRGRVWPFWHKMCLIFARWYQKTKVVQFVVSLHMVHILIAFKFWPIKSCSSHIMFEYRLSKLCNLV